MCPDSDGQGTDEWLIFLCVFHSRDTGRPQHGVLNCQFCLRATVMPDPNSLMFGYLDVRVCVCLFYPMVLYHTGQHIWHSASPQTSHWSRQLSPETNASVWRHTLMRVSACVTVCVCVARFWQGIEHPGVPRTIPHKQCHKSFLDGCKTARC